VKPYKAIPILKERIWGGQKLKQYNKVFEGTNVGESWETDKDTMPVLIKLIDANDILSVQVHPNDALAQELEGQRYGKTEAWIVLDCDEGAELVAGIKPGTTPEKLEQALLEGSVQQQLNRIKVKKGDCIYIPAGTVHSLGKGVLVYEVQQPSDLTYRLYDWDRTDDCGKPRELHIHKALKCIDYSVSALEVKNIYQFDIKPQKMEMIFRSKYFITSYLRLSGNEYFDIDSNSFTALTAISGSAYIIADGSRELMVPGDTWIIPKGCQITLENNQDCEFIFTERLQND